MSTCIPIPHTLRGAGRELRRAFASQPEELPNPAFLRAWRAMAYLFPGLHPDGYEDEGSGWPQALKRFAAEAWRRGPGRENLPMGSSIRATRDGPGSMTGCHAIPPEKPHTAAKLPAGGDNRRSGARGAGKRNFG